MRRVENFNNKYNNLSKIMLHIFVGVLCLVVFNISIFIIGATSSQAPVIESVYALAGDYDSADANHNTIAFYLNFSKNVKLIKEEVTDDSQDQEVPTFVLNLKNPDIQLVYKYTSEDAYKDIAKEEGIMFTYKVLSGVVSLDKNDETIIESIECNGLKFNDSESHILDVNGEFPLVNKNLVISNWFGESGYVMFGNYAQEVVADDEFTLRELERSNMINGTTRSLFGKKYLREDDKEGLNKYYEIEPILWRVLVNDGMKLTLLSDKVIDAKMYSETLGETVWSSNDATHIRNFLNDNNLRNTYDETGFINKAFNEEEQSFLIDANVKTEILTNDVSIDQGEDTTDKVFIPTYKDIRDSNLGFIKNDDRVGLATIYAISKLDYEWVNSVSGPKKKYKYKDFNNVNNKITYRLRTIGLDEDSEIVTGSDNTVVIDYDGAEQLEGEAANEIIGIRPMITIPTEIFKYGDGTIDHPYTVNRTIFNEAKINSSEAISDNSESTQRAKIGDTITATIIFDKYLYENPEVTIAGKNADVIKDSETMGKYVATYILDGSEGLEENEGIEIYIYNMVDVDGKETPAQYLEDSDVIVYDSTSPILKDFKIYSDSYDSNKSISIYGYFNEDTVLKNTEEVDKYINFKINVPVDPAKNGGLSERLIEAKYLVSAQSEKLMPRGAEIEFVYTPADGEVFEFDYKTQPQLTGEAIDFDVITAKDYTGNDLLYDNLVTNVVLNITRWDEDRGYVSMGYFPKEKVTNKGVIDELNALDQHTDRIVDKEGVEYVYKNGSYFIIQPITWRVIDINSRTITLITDDIIDVNTRTRGMWSEEYILDDIEDGLLAGTTKTSIRSYLNSEYNSLNFSDSGFLAKAFMEDKDKIIISKVDAIEDNGSDEKDTYDKVFLLGLAESNKYKAGISIRTDYAAEGGKGSGYIAREKAKIIDEGNSSDSKNGIRTTIKMLMESLTCGEGVKENPYSIIDNIFNKPVIRQISNTNEVENYVMANPVNGSIVQWEIKFDEVPAKDPILKVSDKKAIITKINDLTYNASYTFDGSEDFKDTNGDNTGVRVEISNLEDMKGNKISRYLPTGISNILQKDDDVPYAKKAYMVKKNYMPGDTIRLNMQFTEDIVVRRGEAGAGSASIEINHPEAGNLTLTLSRPNGSSNLEKLEREGLHFEYTLKSGESYDISDSLNVFDPISVPTFNNLRITDKSGKDVVFTNLADIELELTFETTTFEGTKGYINMGRYPQELIQNNVILELLESKNIANGEKIIIEGKEYLRDDNTYSKKAEYFVISPIKWRVIEATDSHVFVISDKILESRTLSKDDYMSDARPLPITDDIGNTGRTYLNSTYKSPIGQYYNSGFLGKAFTDEEREYIWALDPEVDQIGESNEYVFFYSLEELHGDRLDYGNGYDRNLGRPILKNTLYAKCNLYRKGTDGEYFLRKGRMEDGYYEDYFGSYTSNTHGIRPGMKLKIDGFKFGDGSENNPYSFYEIDNSIPVVSKFTEINSGKAYPKYIKNGDTIGATIEFNEPLATIPNFNIKDKVVKTTRETNSKFSFTYTFDGSEGINEAEIFNICVSNIGDANGNYAKDYYPEVFQKLTYDNIAPTISNISIKADEYANESNMPFAIIFSEDIMLIDEAGDSYFSFNSSNPNVTDIKYSIDQNSNLIKSVNGIKINKTNQSGSNIIIDIFDNTISECNNFAIENMKIIDKAGNEFKSSGITLPKLSKVILNTESDMWIEIGSYPTSLVENDIRIAELDKLNGKYSGQVISYKLQEYLYEIRGKKEYYYAIDPIKWKVAKVIGKDAVLITDKVIDARYMTLVPHDYEYKTGLFMDAPINIPSNNESYNETQKKIGTSIRSYLNSNIKGTAFRESGFLQETFTSEERECLNIVDRQMNEGDTITKDMVWLPKTSEIYYDFSSRADATDYAYYPYYALSDFTSLNSRKIIGNDGAFNNFDFETSIGVRPMISVKLEDIRYGEGTYENPYKRVNSDTTPPKIIETSIELDGVLKPSLTRAIDNEIDENASEYIRDGVKVTLNVKYDEPLFEVPVVKIEGFNTKIIQINENEYSASYTFTGEEEIKNEEKISLEILNSVDMKGNTLQEFIPPQNDKIIYDSVNPYVENIAADFKKYNAGDEIEFRFRFNEDVIMKNTGVDSKITIDVDETHYMENGRDEYSISNITYNFPGEDEIIVGKGDGITLTYTLGVDEFFEIHTFDEYKYELSNLIYNNIEIRDYAGNILDERKVPELSRVLNITKWNEGNGYVTLGKFPKRKVGYRDDDDVILRNELLKLNAMKDNLVVYDGREYLVKNDEFYEVSPIIWRVIDNDGIKLTLLSEYVLESRSNNAIKINDSYEAGWEVGSNNPDYNKVPISSTIGLGMRTYLNSSLVTAGTYSGKGFIGKAFEVKEQAMLLNHVTNDSSEDIYDVKKDNLVYLPTSKEMDSELLKTSKTGKATSYSLIGNAAPSEDQEKVAWYLRNWTKNYRNDSLGVCLFTNEQIGNSDSGKAYGIRPMIDIKLDEFKSGFGEISFPFTVNEERPAPEVTKMQISSNNDNPSYACPGTTIRANIIFNQILKENPKVIIAGEEAVVTKKGTSNEPQDIVYEAEYVIDGTEDLKEGELLKLSIQNATNLKGYMSDEMKPLIKNPIIYDCTSPDVTRIEVTSDVYKLDEAIPFTMVFSENVSISHLVGNDHCIYAKFKELKTMGARFDVEASVRNIKELEGYYIVRKNDEAITLTLENIELDSLRIRDNAGNLLDLSKLPQLIGKATITTEKLTPKIIPAIEGSSTEEDVVTYVVDFGREVTGFSNSTNDLEVHNGVIKEFKSLGNGIYNYYEIQVGEAIRGESQTLVIKAEACRDSLNTQNEAASCTIDILKKDISEGIKIKTDTYIYDKKEKKAEVKVDPITPCTIEYEGINGTIYERQITAPTEVGEYKVYATVYTNDPNYYGDKEAYPLIIKPKEIDVSVIVNDKVSGGTTDAEIIIEAADKTEIEKGDIVTFTYESATFSDNVIGSLKDVEIVGIKSNNKNYKVLNDNLVTQGNIVAPGTEIILDDIDTIYNGEEVEIVALTETEGATFEYEILKGGERVTEVKDVGSYTVTAKMLMDDGSGNQIEARRKTISVNVRPMELELIVSADDKTYDGYNNAVANIVADNVIGTDECIITYTKALFSDEKVGNDKVVSVSGIKLSNSNYVSATAALTTASIFAIDKLDNVKSSILDGTRVYANNTVSLSNEMEGAKIFYSINDGEEALYIIPITITEDMVIKAYAQKEGYEQSEIIEFKYTIRNLERIMAEINSETVIGEDIKDILEEIRDTDILTTPHTTLGKFNNLTSEYKTKVVNEIAAKNLSDEGDNADKKYKNNIEFNTDLLKVIEKYEFESSLGGALGQDIETIINSPLLIKEIEDAKISYEELEGDVKDIVSDDLIGNMGDLYQKILERLNYNISTLVDEKEIIVYGLASRFIDKEDDVTINIESAKNEVLNEKISSMNKDLNIITTYDIKTFKEKDSVKEYIQPKSGESVVVKIEIPSEIQGDEFTVYHLKDNDETLDDSDIVSRTWNESKDGKEYVLFETESFSNFVITYADYYDVEITATDGGTVVPSPGMYKIEEEGSLSLDISAIPGYIIYAVVVNGEYKTLDTSDAGIFELNNIKQDTKVEVKFKLKYEPVTPGGPSGGGSSSGSGGGGGTIVIEKVVEADEEVHKPYIKGFNDGTFGPYKTMSRAELAMIFARLSEDFDEDEEYSHNCSDIVEGSWYGKQAAYCYEKGIMIGFKDGTFKPHKVLTKAELIVALARYAELDHSDNESRFDDAKGCWFEKEVVAFEDLRLLDGRPGGLLGAYSEVVRSESCKLINSAIGRTPNRVKIKDLSLPKPYRDVSMTSWYIGDVLEASYEHKLSEFH